MIKEGRERAAKSLLITHRRNCEPLLELTNVKNHITYSYKKWFYTLVEFNSYEGVTTALKKTVYFKNETHINVQSRFLIYDEFKYLTGKTVL